MKETWKSINECGEFYEVSSFGNIRALDRWCNTKGGVKQLRFGHPMKQKITCGYYYCALSYGKKMRNLRVHRIVAVAFVPNPENKPYVNHKNGNKLDNRTENLEWVTAKENSQHAINELGISQIGEKHHATKFTSQDIVDIRNMYKPKIFDYHDIAAIYKVHPTTIGYICRRKNWSHIK